MFKIATIFKRFKWFCPLKNPTEILRLRTCKQNFVKIDPSLQSISWSHTHTRKLFLLLYLSQMRRNTQHSSPRSDLHFRAPLWNMDVLLNPPFTKPSLYLIEVNYFAVKALCIFCTYLNTTIQVLSRMKSVKICGNTVLQIEPFHYCINIQVIIL